MTDATRPGLLTDTTIKRLSEANQKLLEAFLALESAALLVSRDVAGGNLPEVTDETVEACNFHPLYRHVWKFMGELEDNALKLQRLVDLERK